MLLAQQRQGLVRILTRHSSWRRCCCRRGQQPPRAQRLRILEDYERTLFSSSSSMEATTATAALQVAARRISSTLSAPRNETDHDRGSSSPRFKGKSYSSNNYGRTTTGGGDGESRSSWNTTTTTRNYVPLRISELHQHWDDQPPPEVCVDPDQLEEWTREILAAPVGSLFSHRAIRSRYGNNASSSAPEESYSSSYGRNKNDNSGTTTATADKNNTGGGGASSSTLRRQRYEAWAAADGAVRKVEFVLRGHALRVPGSITHRAMHRRRKGDHNRDYDYGYYDPADARRTLETMEALIDRMYAEGEAYMRSLRAPSRPRGELDERNRPPPQGGYNRDQGGDLNCLDDEERKSDRLSRLAEDLTRTRGWLRRDWLTRPAENSEGMTTTASTLEDFLILWEALEPDKVEAAFIDLVADGWTGSEIDVDYSDDDSDDDDHDDESSAVEPYTKDFALPGPTVPMFDTLLDAMACYQEAAAASAKNNGNGDNDDAPPAVVLVPPLRALAVFYEIYLRHCIDGVVPGKDDVRTLPTPVSYTAPMRIAASLPFNSFESAAAVEKAPRTIRRLRDEALLLSFMPHRYSGILQESVATYAYLLRAVAKYLPPCRSKGHISQEIFARAAREGLIDQSVIDAFVSANTPPNGDEFEAYLEKYDIRRESSSASSGDGIKKKKKKGIKTRFPAEWKEYAGVGYYYPGDSAY